MNDYGWVVILFSIAGAVSIVLFLFIRNSRCCERCGSCKNTPSTKRVMEWGTDVGGILQTDPYYVLIHKRTCNGCGHTLKETRELESCF